MIAGIIIITLLVCLAAKELASASESESAQRLARFLTIPMVPLLIVFLIIVALKIAEILA